MAVTVVDMPAYPPFQAVLSSCVRGLQILNADLIEYAKLYLQGLLRAVGLFPVSAQLLPTFLGVWSWMPGHICCLILLNTWSVLLLSFYCLGHSSFRALAFCLLCPLAFNMLVKGFCLLSIISTQIWSPVFASHHHQHQHHHRSSDTKHNASAEYDYIVVGSGAGGGPLAARLARGGHKVLLIDAGDDQGDSPYQQIPAMQLHSTEHEAQQWQYFVNHYENLTRQEEDSKMV